jgi:hypothetical protein
VAAWRIWPVFEILHCFGLSLLFGGLLVIDLRPAEHFRQLDIVATHALIPIVLAGLIINFITGILYFNGDPVTYASNAVFQLKMVLIAFAGRNALVYYWMQRTGWTPDSLPLGMVVKVSGQSSRAEGSTCLCCVRMTRQDGRPVLSGGRVEEAVQPPRLCVCTHAPENSTTRASQGKEWICDTIQRSLLAP